jgi:hypothetical protein
MGASRRSAAFIACCIAVLAVLLPQAFAGAAGTDYELTNGWVIHGATVTCPGSSAPRTMSGKHAAAFIEAWYPATFFNSLTKGTPPASLKVCKFLATDTIRYPVSSSSGETTYKDGNYQFKALYASQGKQAWVGLPPQQVGPGAVVSKLFWFVAPPRVTPAFLGKLDPVSGPSASTTTTTTAPVVRKDTSSGSSAAPWIIIAVVAALLGAGAVVVVARRRASGAPEPPPA